MATATLNAAKTAVTIVDNFRGTARTRVKPVNTIESSLSIDSAGNLIMSLIQYGVVLISIASAVDADGYGNTIFGVTSDPTAANAACQTTLGDAGGSGGGGSGGSNSIQVAATGEVQTSLPLLAGVARTFAITPDIRLLTVCTDGADLVYYTTDGSTPTSNSAWFFPYAKETWDSNIPVGATMKFLSPTASKVVIITRN